MSLPHGVPDIASSSARAVRLLSVPAFALPPATGAGLLSSSVVGGGTGAGADGGDMKMPRSGVRGHWWARGDRHKGRS